MAKSKDAEYLLTLTKAAGRLFGRNLERLLDKIADKAADKVEETGEKIKDAYNAEAEKLPDGYSKAEKAGTIAGRLADKGIGKVAKLAKKGINRIAGKAEEEESSIKCYKADAEKCPDKNIRIKMGGREVLALWESEGMTYAALDTSYEGSMQIAKSCGITLGEEVPLELYIKHARQEKKGV